MAAIYSTPPVPRMLGFFGSGVVQCDTPGKKLLPSPSVEVIRNNDDESERAKARAARVAQKRREAKKGVANQGSQPLLPEENVNILSQDALKLMLQNCLKLANANKINQGNTWDLKLIDHLSELVRNDTDDNAQTNFQLASCTLETGVKIYSLRVDSVHSEAWKLYGGLSRSANEEVPTELPAQENSQGPLSLPSAKSTRKAGFSTLASVEALHVKRFDVAFNVDPLFHQTSAMFDEGGAQGLLVHNLSVYSGCEIIFDSLEVPEICMKAQAATAGEGPGTVDLSFMNDIIESMLDGLLEVSDITPTLRDIVKLINDPYRASFEAEVAQVGQASHTPDYGLYSGSWSGTPGFDNAEDSGPGEIFNRVDDGFDNGSFNESSPASVTTNHTRGGQEDFDDLAQGPGGDVYISQDPLLEWLEMSNDAQANSNAWAGPDHWKYAKPKEATRKDEADGAMKKKVGKKKRESFLYTCLDREILNDWSEDVKRPEKARHVLGPRRFNVHRNALPKDLHYGLSNISQYYLRSSVWVCVEIGDHTSIRRPATMHTRGKSKRKSGRTTPTESSGNGGDVPHWAGDEEIWSDGYDYRSVGSGDEAGPRDIENLLPESRKVEKIPVKFDRTAKIVDVRLLKQTIWEQVLHGPVGSKQETGHDEKDGLSFHQMLESFPEDCSAAFPKDISVHLCFICLLHLANEHTLRIDDCSSMDDLRIFFAPAGSEVLPG